MPGQNRKLVSSASFASEKFTTLRSDAKRSQLYSLNYNGCGWRREDRSVEVDPSTEISSLSYSPTN
jgi:hypothetical protein